MAQAKKRLTGDRVQGRSYSTDPLDLLIEIAAEIANRNGLLDEDLVDLATRTDGDASGASTDHLDDQRSA